MTRNIIVFLLSFLLLPLRLHAQQEHFIRMNESEGLPHNSVNAIFGDSKGFIWFGTGEGLCKFDGYKYQIYKSSIDDSASLSHNQVFDIDEDKNGDLWISTYSGLNRFDRKTSTFTSFFVDSLIKTSTSKNFFLKTQIDAEGNLWSIVAEKGLFKFDPLHQTFEQFTFPENIPGGSKNQDIQSFFLNKDGNIWLTSSYLTKTFGLYLYNPHKKVVTSYIPDPGDPESLTEKGFTTVLEDKKGNVWIGRYDGVEKLNPLTGKVTHYCHEKQVPEGKVDVLEEDNEGNIWIGTSHNGLIKLDPESEKSYAYQNDPKNKKSISSNTVLNILNDKKGILWVGTDKGLNQLILKRKAFHNYLYVSDDDEISSANQITDLFTDKNDIIWYCTGAGLYKYDGVTKPELVLPVYCKELVQDKTGKFWLIGYDLMEYDPISKNLKRYPVGNVNSKNIDSHGLWSLYKDSEDMLWIGTGGEGLYSFDLKTRTIINYQHDPIDENSISTNEVGPILRDKNEVWIGPYNGGLDKINIKTGKITRYAPDPEDPNSLSNDVVSAIHKDNKGRMWIGTYEGLNVLDQDQKKFRRIKQKDGLASEHISVNGITEDKNGNIWVATAAGISKINSETFAIRNYDSRDGFQKNPVSTLFKNKKGIIYFFGQNGITAFQPEEIEDNALPPQIAITDFLIFNKSVMPGERASLKEDVSEATHINLSYKEAFITFEFAALNYILPEKNQYAYKMEGFDDDWINSGTRRYATYTNLPPGQTYTFRVKGSNNDGIWNDSGTALQLYIKPPFWQTWWFKTILIIIFFVALYVLYRLRTKQLYRQKRKLTWMVNERTKEVEAQKESLSAHATNLEVANHKIRLKNQKIIRQAKKLKAIDRLKTQFLTNISHEFRTPLTLILNPLEEMISKGTLNEDVDAQLSIMNRNAKRLLQLINQLLDLSKIASGSMPLQLSKQDLVQHLRAISFSFNYLAQKHNIKYLFNSEEKVIISAIDIDKFEKIIYNLLSNAFKFTPDEGTISIDIRLSDHSTITHNDSIKNKWIQIKVQDSGIGISEVDVSYIFDRFFQVEPSSERKSEGTGIGLSLTKELVELHGGEISVESSPGQGTCFTILLPVSDAGSEPAQAPDLLDVDYSLPEQNDFSITSEGFKTSEQEGVPLLLIVEDNEDLRHLIKKQFLPYFKVEEAENGIVGWEKAIEMLPDLIISDVMMPGKDGLALCQQLKQDAKTSHIPTILLSAKMDGEAVGLSIGADDYITKPFNSKCLFLKVKNLLESRKRLREFICNDLGIQPIKASTEQNKINPQDQEFLEQASQIAEKNLMDPDFDMETLYRDLGMSRTLVYKKLKSLVGLSPLEFVRQIRLNRAAKLLREEKYTVTEVMHQVGFNHRFYFFTCFKKQFNLSPFEYVAAKKPQNLQ